MSENFSMVTRKKWIARRGVCHQQRPRCVSGPSDEYVDVDAFLKRLEKLCESMAASDYFTQAMSTLKESLNAMELKDKEKLERVVCFGIGPFTRNFQALHQLAFILSTRHHYNIIDTIFFDPVFMDSEKKILQRLECTVMKENCEAKYEANVTTLFYLPHCANCLTNNLLWRNWKPENLQKMVLVSNSFKSVVGIKPERFVRLDSAYILDVLPFVKEFMLEDDYEKRNVFNDLSVHVFPAKEMPALESKLWEVHEAPTYKNEDNEMLFAENFTEKLTLT